MKEKILEHLFNHQQDFTSGEFLSKKFGVSRTAIWKNIKALKEEGYHIVSTPNKGYQLQVDQDRFIAYELEKKLERRVLVFDSIDSTNTYLKNNAYVYEDGTITLSNEQLRGRGRLGRQWHSPKGAGLFFSVLLKPQTTMEASFKITGFAAAAVAEAIEEVTGLPAKIKWPNDIVVNGRKVSGILTEISGELDGVNYIVVGFGVNVNTSDFPAELTDIATSLYLEGQQKVPRKHLFTAIIHNFLRFYKDLAKSSNTKEVQSILRHRSTVLNKKITVLKGNEKQMATAVDLTEEGYLKVRYATGKEEILTSGEVSIRGEEPSPQ